MAETWKTNPPYRNWRDFHSALSKYADERIEKAQLPEGVTPAKWYAEHAEQLRRKSTQREENSIVAVALLPLFEAEPETGSRRILERGPVEKDRPFTAFLQDWHSNAPPERRPFIVKVGRLLGLAIDSR